LAVLRLKAIRNAGKELSEEEEEKLPGCPWAVNHQLANYCFFKYVEDYMPEKQLSDTDIASLNCISVDTVKKTEKNAIAKIKADEEMKELKKQHDNESIINEKDLDQEYTVND
jgi:hypothetical protein